MGASCARRANLIPLMPCVVTPIVRRRYLLAAPTVACLLLTSCTRPAEPVRDPAGHQRGEEGAVLAVMDDYLRALSANDLARMAHLQTPDGMTYVARPSQADTVDIIAQPNAFWVDPARKNDSTVRERYWSPTVLVRGPIAIVWAPYEFWADGKTSHCGVDVFDFVKMHGQWRLANAMWTVEPDGCQGLRPADAAALRPTE
jgi:Putative lumazine-binding